MMKKLLIVLLAMLLAIVPAASCLAEYDMLDFADEEIPMPLSDEMITLTYFKGMDGSKIAPTTDTYDTLACMDAMEAITNVHIEWVIPPIGQNTEKFNLMLAGDDLTDIIEWNWASSYSGGAQAAIDDYVVLRLNDIWQEYCPNMTHLITINEEANLTLRTDNGDIYCFPYLRINQEVKSVYGYQLRADWLEELGLDAPTTIEDWHTVLNAFKEKGTNDEGEKIIPLVSRGMTTGWPSAVRFFANAWGVDYGYSVIDGVVQYGPYMDAYKDYIATMKQWYDEGLIDVEFPTTDDAMHDAKVTSNIAGAWLSGLGSGMGNYITALGGDGDKLIGATYPVLEKGDTAYSSLMDQMFDGTGAAITVDCEYPEIAAQYCDWWYSREGHMLVNFGIEGESYTVDENGIPHLTEVITDNPDGYSLNVAMGLYSLGTSSAAYYQDPLLRTYRMYDYASQEDASKKWNGGTMFGLPPVSYTSEESSEMTAIESEINTYRDEMFMKFLLGTESLDNFEAYQKQLANMGVERAVAIRQAAYDRYMARG